jgi:ATP-dependent Lon protease
VNTGEGEEDSYEACRLRLEIRKACLPDKVEIVARKELNRLKILSTDSDEFPSVVDYLDTLLSVPWNKSSTCDVDLKRAQEILNEDHWGLDNVKERVLEHLAVLKLSGSGNGELLCLYGPPGVGKTSISRSIARALGRKLIHLSLGGVTSASKIRGHRCTYVGAKPGDIIQGMIRVGENNPVIVLDEVDKIGKDHYSNLSGALLEVLDCEQNSEFKDNYLNVGFDLSKVFFIITVNNPHCLSSSLRDRLDLIRISGYSFLTKVKIAKEHLVLKQKERNGLGGHDISFSDDALNGIVGHTDEAGVRGLDRSIKSVFRKIAKEVVMGGSPPSIIDARRVVEILGPLDESNKSRFNESRVGLSTGLVWTARGGSVMLVESVCMLGKGFRIGSTGNLGMILRESIDLVCVWIHVNRNKLGLKELGKKRIHVHFPFPSGATPKDGPSSGIAILASVLSSLFNKPIKSGIAMTGEIGLSGDIIAVGSIAEKIAAAHRRGIKKVIVPKGNTRNINNKLEVPCEILCDMEIVFVSTIHEVIEILFGGG